MWFIKWLSSLDSTTSRWRLYTFHRIIIWVSHLFHLLRCRSQTRLLTITLSCSKLNLILNSLVHCLLQYYSLGCILIKRILSNSINCWSFIYITDLLFQIFFTILSNYRVTKTLFLVILSVWTSRLVRNSSLIIHRG